MSAKTDAIVDGSAIAVFRHDVCELETCRPTTHVELADQISEDDCTSRGMAGRLKPAQREPFFKHVADVLRAKQQPLSNTNIRSACCASLLNYSAHSVAQGRHRRCSLDNVLVFMCAPCRSCFFDGRYPSEAP